RCYASHPQLRSELMKNRARWSAMANGRWEGRACANRVPNARGGGQAEARSVVRGEREENAVLAPPSGFVPNTGAGDGSLPDYRVAITPESLARRPPVAGRPPVILNASP